MFEILRFYRAAKPASRTLSFGMDSGFSTIDNLPRAHWHETEFSDIRFWSNLITPTKRSDAQPLVE